MNLRNKLAFWMALNRYVEMVVSGAAPLSLPNAVEKEIPSLIAYGDTEQRNLPKGYTQLEYIESTRTQYIDLGYKGNENTKVEVKFKYHTATSATGSGRVFGSRTTSSSNAFAFGTSSGVVSATGNKVFWCYDAQLFFIIDGPAFPVGDWQTVVFSATEHTLNGVSYGDDYNVVEFETPQNLKLFGFDNDGTMGYGQVDVAYCKVWDNGVLIRDFVPCKNASNVIGMYDLVNDVFYQNAGTGDFVAGPTAVPNPDAPIDITCNNGVLQLRHQSGLPLGYTLLNRVRPLSPVEIPYKPNYNTEIEFTFFKHAAASQWLYKADSDSAGTTNFTAYAGGYWRFDGTAVNIGTISVASHRSIHNKDGVILDGVKYNYNAVPESFTSVTNLAVGSSSGSGGVISIGQLKIRENGVLLMHYRACQRDSDNAYGLYDIINDTFLTFEVNSISSSVVADPIGVYPVGAQETIAIKANGVTGSTAVAEMLLKVGDYQDEQQILSGVVTRNIGIKVLDSSLVWTYDSTYGRVNATIPNLWGSTVARTVPGFCTHFKWLSNQESISSITPGQCYSAGANRIFLHISQTSAAAFAAWLDAQKDAGTPVIIVFPLENATTESVAGQTLQVQAGDNTLEITQASMAPLSLSVTYYKQG